MFYRNESQLIVGSRAKQRANNVDKRKTKSLFVPDYSSMKKGKNRKERNEKERDLKWFITVSLAVSSSVVDYKIHESRSEGGRLDANWLPTLSFKKASAVVATPFAQAPTTLVFFFSLSPTFSRTYVCRNIRACNALLASSYRFISINRNISGDINRQAPRQLWSCHERKWTEPRFN